MTIAVLLITAVVFFVLSFFVKGVWSYYVPISLIILSFWIILIKSHFKNIAHGIIYKNPDLFEADEKEMLLSSPSIFIPKIVLITFFFQVDPGASASYAMFISLIYSVIALFTQNWIGLIICISIFLFILFGINVSFAGHPEDDVSRFIIRYSKAQKFDRKKLSEYEISLLMDSYNTILEKLNFLISPHQKEKVNSLEAENSSKKARPYIVSDEEYEKDMYNLRNYFGKKNNADKS
jgi:hypothetical protein